MIDYTGNNPVVALELALDAVTAAWGDLHEAHLNFEGLNPDKMDDFAWWQVADVEEKANKYFKAVQKWAKLVKKKGD